MSFGAEQDLQLLGILVALGGLLALAPTLRLPLPILLVLGGVFLGFVPGLPHVVLAPDVVLVALLPPLLYSGAFFTSLRDLRTNRRPIAFLAFGLVGATMAVVAVVAHEWIGLPWAVAFTLGAIVSPTDALAATEIAGRLGAPRRVVSLIEGESLVNDGTALVLYRAAVGAAIGGTFSLLEHVGADRRRRDRRDRHRAGGRLGRPAGAAAARRPADRGRHRRPERLPRLPAGGRDRRLRRARGRDDRRLHGLAYARAHERADAADRRRLLGDPRVPRERAPLRSGRAPASEHRRRALGHSDVDARRLLVARLGDGDRDQDRARPDLHLPTAVGVQVDPRARPVPAVAVPGGDLVGGHPRCRLAGRRARPAERLSPSRPDRLPHVRRDRRDARAPGPHAALA